MTPKIAQFVFFCIMLSLSAPSNAQQNLFAKRQPRSENLLKGSTNTRFPMPKAGKQYKGKWRHYQAGCYGTKESRKDLRVPRPSYDKGTGSIRIGVFEPQQPSEWLIDLKKCAKTNKKTRFGIKDFIQYGKMPVHPNTFYTFSFRARTAHVRPSNALNVSVTKLKEGNIHRAYSLSKKNSWEELVLAFKTGAEDTEVQLTIAAFTQVDGKETPIYVDDIYFGQGLGFQDIPAAKTPF